MRAMRKIVNVTDGTIEQIGVAESDSWPGDTISVDAELYEVVLSEESDGDGWVYVTDTTHPRS